MRQFLVFTAQYGALRWGNGNHKNGINTMTRRDLLTTLVGGVRAFLKEKSDVGFFFQKRPNLAHPRHHKIASCHGVYVLFVIFLSPLGDRRTVL